ncbi:MAG: hypothetical protein Q9163_000582 [Psora crenata]
MSRLVGSPIGQNWLRQFDQSKSRLLEQLRDYIHEMRILKPTSGKVEGVDGSKLYDMRIPGGINGFVPFDTIPDFHSFLTGGIRLSSDQFPEVNELVTMYEDSEYTTRFTHGDLSNTNIFVDGDKVVGIIDWDTSGWYPEYWEYMTAWNVNPYNEFWRDEVGKFLQLYPEALTMKEIRR